jgi:hypothetical protein
MTRSPQGDPFAIDRFALSLSKPWKKEGEV